MKKYDSYKDSGIEWIGEIPIHWIIYRIDWVTKIVRGNTAFKKDELLDDGEYVALQYGKTYKVDVVDDSFRFFVNSEFFNESQIVSSGDTILISTSETIEDLGHTCFYKNQNIGLIGGEQILLKPNLEFFYEKYLYHYSRQFGSELKRYAKGLKVFRFSTNDLKRLFIAIPSIVEQTAIANYLDQKTTQIDDLIAKKERLIQLLEEERTAIINQAVTKGLDPTVPMKDSGIEWLGEIPEHWECNQLRRFIEDKRKVTYGIVQPGEFDPNGRFMVRGQDYSKGWAVPETIFRVSPKIEEPYARARLKTGDILYTIVGAGVGNIAVVPEWLNEANITQTTARLAINQEKANSEYIFYFLQSTYAEIQLSIYVKGAAQPGMNLSDLKVYYFTLPPFAEQKDIATFIKIHNFRISEATDVLSREIQLIKEYKTALISEVVTGKVDVRNENLS